MATPPCFIIAIDGGAASGKSSTSRLLADRFNLLHVDTGSFYRHITAELLRLGVAPADLPAVRTALAKLQFTTRLNGRSAQMLVGGQPAGDEIRGQGSVCHGDVLFQDFAQDLVGRNAVTSISTLARSSISAFTSTAVIAEL